VDDAGSAQLPAGPRHPRDSSQVGDQGSRRPVHRFLRRRVRRGRHQDSRQPTSSAQSQRHLREDHRTLRRELSGRLLIVNDCPLRQVLNEYLLYYNTARPHRALGQFAPTQADIRPPEINLAEHPILGVGGARPQASRA